MQVVSSSWLSLLPSIPLCEQTVIYPFCSWRIFGLFAVKIILSVTAYEHSCIHLFSIPVLISVGCIPRGGVTGSQVHVNIFSFNCWVVF